MNQIESFKSLRQSVGMDRLTVCRDFGISEATLDEIEAGILKAPNHIIQTLELLNSFSAEMCDNVPTKNESLNEFNDFIDYISKFNRVGRATEIYEKNDIKYFVNDFWTARQRQSNRIHEISYRACFKAELPSFFIERLTNHGDIVLDPFMGRGTTLVQSSILGRVPFGNDINPLSKMLVVPRLNPPKIKDVEKKLLEIKNSTLVDDADIENSEMLVFFHPTVLREIIRLRNWFIERMATGQIDDSDEWIRMVSLNRLTGHSSGFFSVYTLPPNQATSVKRQKKINEKRKQTPEPKDVYGIILKKSKSLLSQYRQEFATSEYHVSTGSAHNLGGIDNDKVSLIVTSPPFLDIVDYAQDNWMRAWFGGFSIDTINIAIHKKPEDWTAFVRNCLKEFCRVLKPNGHIAFEVGEVRNGRILLEELVVKAAEGLPLKVHGVMINDQKFFKTSNSWGVTNNSKGTNTNRIVVMERS